ncbi:glycosyltransferase family 2 protein, partial [bacterium]|nr:glycosyltransferase family 2 protein [bacterium]
MNNIKIYIIIATSKKRTELLINRSLQSIYSQKKINTKNIEIIIVDDNIRMQENSISEEYIKIKEKIELLRTKFEFFKDEYKTHLLSNTRTQFNSGTGAWNTAIDFIKNERDNNASYTAILDDDDEYKENYIYEIIKRCKSNTVAIFTTIIWRDNNFERINNIEKEKLTPKDFFIGNPGVQGSNMFFSSDILEMIGGFDENMPSTTDRDLMIRFLDYLNQNNISKDLILVLDEPLVIHNAMGSDRVTDNLILKKRGLDIFYNKYKTRFTELDFRSSIERAKKLFKYEYHNKKIVIGMPLKNGAKTIKRAVASILNQKNLRRELLLIIANDNSTDNWNDELKEFENDNRIIIINVNFGKSYKVRNYINSFIREHIPDVEYIGRLDSDDYVIDDQ